MESVFHLPEGALIIFELELEDSFLAFSFERNFLFLGVGVILSGCCCCCCCFMAMFTSRYRSCFSLSNKTASL